MVAFRIEPKYLANFIDIDRETKILQKNLKK